MDDFEIHTLSLTELALISGILAVEYFVNFLL